MDSQASGAVELLDPHLPSLSQYWLAALKDHAYLSLPPQFGTQLPSAGGTFYSNNTMESVKPYYEANWPSLLHAAAIWLESKGLKETSQQAPVGGDPSAHPPEGIDPSAQPPVGIDPSAQPIPFGNSLMPAADAKYECFHLILGLAVQALCIPATLDHPPTVLSCLHTLRRLLLSKYSRGELSSDSQLAIEMLNVLHRLLLTCQSHGMHFIVLEIAVLVGDTLLLAGSTKTELTTGGGELELSSFKLENALEPGKSCAYALLEVSACCLLRLVPDLRPRDSEVPSNSSAVLVRHSGSPSLEEHNIIARSVSILVTAVSLCTPQACIQMLPSVLHMLLSALKYTSLLSSLQPTSILQSLRLLCTVLPLSDEQYGSGVVSVLQSALATVLGVEEKGAMEKGLLAEMEEETRLLVVAVLLRAPVASICPPASELFDGCVLLFKQCLQSGMSKVRNGSLACETTSVSSPTFTNFL